MKNWYWIVIILVLVIVAALERHQIKSFLGGSTAQPVTQTQTAVSTPTPIASESATPSTATESATMQSFTVEGNEFKFAPSTLTVKMNQPVQITFKNTGKYPHNLTISALNIKTKTIQPGQQDTITFTPSKTGSFEYMCTVDSHAEKGMTGTLTVQ